jgi:hypothetical protein
MLRPRWCLAFAFVAAAVACGAPSSEANLELCQDLTNLQGTIEFLASPTPNASVGDVRGALDKLDGTLETIHHNADISDAADDALFQTQEDYRDVIEGIGDDDAFAPYVEASQGIAQGLQRSAQAVRAELACPAGLQPG